VPTKYQFVHVCVNLCAYKASIRTCICESLCLWRHQYTKLIS